MEDIGTGKAGRALWAVASALLLLVWLASMSLDDDRLCSALPLGVGFAAVLLLAVAGMVAGARPARPTPLCLFGGAAGLYFLIRCVSGDMLSETARELPLLFAAFTFYGAGYLMAQRRGGAALTVALAVGVLVNVAYLFLLRNPDIPIEVTGRPAMSLAGEARSRCTLFAYKNFSAIFLMVAGGVLVCRPFFAGWKGMGGFAAAMVGMVGVSCACLCGSRAVLALPALMVLSAWVLWLIIRLYCGKGIGYGAVVSGLMLLVGFGVLVGELFIGDSLLRQIVSVDTHGRTGIWNYVYSLLPQVPWYGHGAGATQWQLVPLIDEWASPNYAHNDYLQAWVDYGVVGFILMLAVLLLHLASGFWSLASEEVGRKRRALVAACMLILISLAGCAVFDFIWHNIAFVGLTAFACGVLASPVPRRQESLFRRRHWAAGHRPALLPVRFMGRGMAALACVGGLSLAVACGCFAWRLLPAWQAQWEYNALCHADAPIAQRLELLERVLPVYPDPELVDHYMTLPYPVGRGEYLARRETMLRCALRSNPHQLFTRVMLVTVLGRSGRCEEAESLLREGYVPGGMPKTRLANWPGYYGINLLMWGKQRMMSGDHASALSMMEYALNLWGHVGGFRLGYNSPLGYAVDRRNTVADTYIAARRVDVDMLRAIGVEKDDSWKQPLWPDGPPALYEEWGNTPSDAEYRDPYARHSPLRLPKKYSTQ